MIFNVIFVVVYLAGIVYFAACGFMFGWTVDRVVWLCLSTLILSGKLVSIYKERRLADKKARGSTDDY